MAFCPYCGKKLEDGALCDCAEAVMARQGAAVQNNETKPAQGSNYYETPVYNANTPTKDVKMSRYAELMFGVGETIGKVIKRPSEAVPEFAVRGNVGISGIIFLFTYVLTLSYELISMAVSPVTYGVKDYLLQIPESLLAIIIKVLVITVLLLVTTGGKNKQRLKIKQGIALSAAVMVPAIISVILGNYISLIPFSVTRIIARGFREMFDVFGVLYLYFGARAFYEKENKMPMLLGAIYALTSVILSVVSYLF